jgi:hypothetical protein
MTTSPALLAPDPVNAAIDGRLFFPRALLASPDSSAAWRQVVGEKSSDAWHVVLNGIIGRGLCAKPRRPRLAGYTINVPLRDKHVFDTHVLAVRCRHRASGA